jgi:hypothetical protein
VSEIRIQRTSRTFPVTVGTSWTTSTTFPTSGMASLAVTMHGTPSSNATALTMYGADAEGEPFRMLVGGTVALCRVTDGTSFTAVSGSYSFPTSGRHARVRLKPDVVTPFVRLVADADVGSGVSVVVSLKS